MLMQQLIDPALRPEGGNNASALNGIGSADLDDRALRLWQWSGLEGGVMKKARKSSYSVVALALAGLGIVAAAGAASADSPRVDVDTDGVDRCAATWYSGTNQFGIADVSSDGHYCYVLYDFDSNLSDASRINHPTDSGIPTATKYSVSTPGATIYWKLCREVSGPDNCTSQRSDAS